MEKINYNKEYKNYNLKLHKIYDKDIIDYLSDKRIKQTICKLIRKEIKRQRELNNE